MFGKKRNHKPEPKTLMLREYELCQDAAQSLESTIWQTGTAMALGSIGTFILVVTARDQPAPRVALIIGLLTFFAGIVWWFMARRWWSIQHAIFLRMKHIEEDQDNGMGRVRYLHYLDEPQELASSGFPEPRREELKHRAGHKRLDVLPDHQKAGIHDVSIALPFIVLAAWLLYALHLWISG